ncbi:protein-L-isoaspartate(D-aspartate) O-methyltransferase [Anoxynatronum buryatiense]|uniref:Protein-L-isoaspartate O-methyltransferase n=1 Tax=Anoxynatronum buryatiense TaxID=489973 RepID=A0AA45WXP8_9CLOT|nr:protein-L-isoaspartate(D-aspartate) O-methyltransferase [Anoxynatronum buryatiense]SMP60201.1 protein-L-isoaspartate(D-aspartate) O-methyltransferase [Anoxynatronum buryatiense]
MATIETLIQRMKDRGILQTPALEEAFRQVDRCSYVPEHLKAQCYADHPLAIGVGQTISQPSTVALMLEMLQVEPGNRILDVGSGSCWTTALLACLTGAEGRVIALERIGALADFGRRNLAKGHWPQAVVHHANGWHGWEEEAPYHRILVSAAAPRVPEALIRQLMPEGILVMPLSDWGGSMLRLIRQKDGTLTRETQGGFAFVPFVETDEIN